MANSLKKNCYFIDTVGSVATDAQTVVVLGLLITPNAADSRVTIKESASGTVVIDVRISTTESRYISFEAFSGIEMRGTFEVATLTNIDSCILYGYFDAPVNQARKVVVK